MTRANGVRTGARRAGLVAMAVLAGAIPCALGSAAAADDALEACRALASRAERDEVRACYRALLTDDAGAAERAEAHWALGERSEANRMFRRALELAPESIELRLRWAELYRETHQPSEALALLREAERRDPARYATRLGVARVLIDESQPGGTAEALRLVETHPERAEGHLLLARVALEQADATRALEHLETARIDDACTPAALEAYAWRAAAMRLAASDRPSVDDEWSRRALACAPRSGAVFERQADVLVLSRRYREAVLLLERAIEVEPERWSAHSTLALQQMRLNRLAEARAHLEIAYEGDRFDPEIVNLLRLLDRLDGFRTFRFARAEEPRASQAAEADSTWLELRLDPREADRLVLYTERLSARAVEVFERKFGHRLSEPIVVEMYPDHDDFAVRTAGIPGLGILGATFGHVVAMDSPAARKSDEDFLWGSVLWHELAHVYTLEASGHRVSRWFTEGISVYEEWTSGPSPQRALPISFVEALTADRLLPIADLDRGFQQPQWPGQVGVSYVQAGVVCEYIAARFGEDRFREILAGYRRGEETTEILERVLGKPLEVLDRESLAFARERAGALVSGLDRWRELRAELLAAVEEQAWERVLEFADALEALHPLDASLTGPHAARVRALRALGRTEAFERALEGYRSAGGLSPELLRELADTLRKAGRADAAMRVLEALRDVIPLEEWLHAELGRAYQTAGRHADAVAELELWRAADPIDRVGVHFALAQSYRALEQSERARRELLYALEVAPEFRPGLELLLELRP